MRGHLEKKIAQKSRNSCYTSGGVWVHRDNWLGAQMGSVLEPNTNAQRMFFLSHLLCSSVFASVRDCYSFSCAVSNRESRYPRRRRERWCFVIGNPKGKSIMISNRLRRNLQRFCTNVHNSESIKCDSKVNLWAFVFGSRTGHICT